jgi:serine O-acetyltransferase
VIESRSDLRRYLAADARAHNLDANPRVADLVARPQLRWQRLLRRTEYAHNCWRGPLRPFALALRLYWLRRSVRLGFSIPLNVFAEGVAVRHYGTVVVSGKSRIGPGCRIHASTNIGEKNGLAPRIGARCFIGAGANLIGGISLGDDVRVGANAVVTRDVPSGMTVVGVPARPIDQLTTQI